MKKLLVFIAVFFALGTAARADASHDVLAHSSGDWAWFAHVIKSTTPNAVETPVSNEQSELYVRHNGPGEEWRELPSLTGRAVALASRSSQLAVLMNDGQWLTVWSDGSATGQPLPADGRIKAFADDGSDLWAVGSVAGGMSAANEAIYQEMASTIPSTSPTRSFAATNPAKSTLPARLVLFHQVNGRWATAAEFPADELIASDEDLSLTVIGGLPLVSFRAADGGVKTLRFTADHTWQRSPSVKPAATTQPAANFRMLSDGFKPILWITTGNAPGELFPNALDGPDAAASIPLPWTGTAQLDGVPSATFAGGYVCVFGPHGDKVLEQRYKATGVPFGTAAELSVPEAGEGLIPHWLEALLLAFMGFSVGARVFRQWLAGDVVSEVESPAPAPLLPRFTAGLIDALPVIAGVGFVLMHTDSVANQGAFPAVKTVIIIGSVIALYLLHTTLAEVFTGRSAGKWVMGLKVVTLEGNPPTRSQYLMRNLLRIVDPLVMILFSPLRQRDADTVANTMVISANANPADENAKELQESDKSDSP